MQRRTGLLSQLRVIRKLCQPGAHKWICSNHNGHDTGIRIHNCVARRKVPLVLANDNYATWYTCGPTVYDSTHLGHASCYVKLDIIQRILRQHFHLNLVTAMNVTDIDDKIIRKSQDTGQDWREIAKFYETEFWTDLRKLNVLTPNLKLRVTDHVPQIVAFIESIIERGFAYEGKDQSVYFEVSKFPTYGKLQKLHSTEEDAAKGEKNKLSAADFALWKARKNVEEPSWASPWGAGRPGWHIECSALASMVFGDSIDFHAGGLDLKFPHHENEEAQSCVYHNSQQWVNYWLHTGQLSVKGQSEKMSKSLRNTISVDEMLTNYTADEFRMACILSNYRNAVQYSDELMETARNTLNKFRSFRADCRAFLTGKKTSHNLDSHLILKNLKYAKQQVDECLKDDFDTARAVSVLLEQTSSISRCINANASPEGLKTSHSLDTIAAVDNFVQYTLDTFGFTFAELGLAAQDKNEEQNIDLNGLLEDILHSRRIIRDRAVATKSQDLFQICDELRNCLRQHGVEIRDHGQGSSWSFNSVKK